MPLIPAGILTQLEVNLLNVTSTLLAVLRYIVEHLPLPGNWAYLNEKVIEELVSSNIQLLMHDLMFVRNLLIPSCVDS